MGARLKDIAERLNVSISTVSYALNGGPRSVPPEVGERIRQTAAELGYRPNRIARSLAAGRTMTIGVVPVVMNAGMVAAPYFQGCFNGIVVESKRRNYDVLLYTHDSFEPDLLTDSLLDGRVDGLVFLAPHVGSSVLHRTAAEGIPFSVLSGPAIDPAPAFNCDNTAGVAAAMVHLVELGHTKIAHLYGNLGMVDGRERLEGFRRGLQDAELQERPEWVAGGAFSTETAHEHAIRILSLPDRPTAIVCANDEMAAGVYRAAWELGIRVPDELSVVGFDDSSAARLILPPLTSVHQPMEEMGAAATGAVVERLSGQPVKGKVFDTALVIRQSTARPTEVYL